MPRGPKDGQIDISSGQKVERKDHLREEGVWTNQSITEVQVKEEEDQPGDCSGVLGNRDGATMASTPDRARKRTLKRAQGSW